MASSSFITCSQPDSATSQKLTICNPENVSASLPQGEAALTARPAAARHMSAPVYESPLRHKIKPPSGTRRHVKETLNAKSEYSNSEDDGSAEHRINQYLIKDEIGRGSFGAVHLAVDQYGNEFAVKEFSKSRLRKRAQSNLLRRPNAGRIRGNFTAGVGFNSPLHRQDKNKSTNSLDLIREEIAIMKKLDHPNVVSLIEVLDDPSEDSLYMVMEMCKKGVVMKVGLGEQADPYDEERSRLWFRDMILGIEYLHAQGILHRDIKPDNCLITDDDVLKFVDFGVSEMFEKNSDMQTAKSAGSPAFMPPELCVARHGEVSGKAADIWSMGVTLYCLRYGRLPFEREGVLELYEAIKGDNPDLGGTCSRDFKDLMVNLLEKDPEARIKIEVLREHPWVTRGGGDPLLPCEQNIGIAIEPPTEQELQNAITGNMGSLLVVMKAVKHFKHLLTSKRPDLIEGIFGRASRIVQPPLSMLSRSKSDEVNDRKPLETAFTSEGILRDIPASEGLKYTPAQNNPCDSPPTPKWGQRILSHLIPSKNRDKSPPAEETTSRRDSGKGHAHDPLEDVLIIGIGAGGSEAHLQPGEFNVVCESPSAVDTDLNVYEKAYQDEIDRITQEKRASRPTLFLTRHVDGNTEIRNNEHITDYFRATGALAASTHGLKKLVELAITSDRGATEKETDCATKPGAEIDEGKT